MTSLRRTRPGPVVAAAIVMMCATIRLHAGQADDLARARALALAGQRDEAITLLQDSVGRSPGNNDARVLLGTVLSWEGRYDEARRELDAVLRVNPTHGDALLASINVELWSDHPGRAEELSRRGLRQRPADPQYLLARVRALVALKRSTEAADALERLLIIDPRNPQGLAVRQTLQENLRVWQARAGASYDGFSDRGPWHESQASVSRRTPAGPILVRGSRAERFGLTDDQIEFEMYPRVRPGTYAYVSGAYAPKARLYPQYRYAADIFQGLGAGFEGSVGFRRLGFGSGVNIYVGSLSKYYGNWLYTGRVFATPNRAGTSRSFHAAFRRYVGSSGTYLGMRYGRGASREELLTRNDLEVLDSDVGAGEANVVLRRRLELNLTGSYSREDRVERGNLRAYSVATALGFRF